MYFFIVFFLFFILKCTPKSIQSAEPLRIHSPLRANGYAASRAL